MNLKTVLENEVMAEVEDVNKTELGTEEGNVKINGAMQIADRYIKLEQVEIEKQKLDIEYKKLEIEQQKVDDEKLNRKYDRKIKISEAAIGFGLTAFGYFVAVGFEREHTFTSNFGRKVSDRMLNAFWKNKN
jgi:translation elongation factor EF-1beta